MAELELDSVTAEQKGGGDAHGIEQFLEARGLEVEARASTKSDPEFHELLRPRRQGTTVRNCQASWRFIKFYE